MFEYSTGKSENKLSTRALTNQADNHINFDFLRFFIEKGSLKKLILKMWFLLVVSK